MPRSFRSLALLAILIALPAQSQDAGTKLLESAGKFLINLGKSDSEAPPAPALEATATEIPDRNLRPQAASGNDKRLALVIGNATYKSSPLANPVNDARAMADKLRSLGFDVIQRENLKTREIGAVYREFRSKIQPGGTALVFYAGHGLQFKGQNYFPAVDSDINSEEDVPLQSLNLSQLLDNMEEAKAGVSLVFLDACRDNPFARRFRSATRGLAKVEAASGTLIFYATKPGSVAADGDGKNGTYTEALLAQMSEPGVPVELMHKKVINRVVGKTKGKQEPWAEGSLRGDFYFIFKGPTTVDIQNALDPDAEAWKAAEALNTASAYRAYLESYPDGRFAAGAKIKLSDPNRLAAEKPAAKPPAEPIAQNFRPSGEDPESQFWAEVKGSGSREYYDAYLKQYPKGKYVALARLEIKKQDDKDKADKAREDAERKADQARQEAAQKQLAEQQRQEQQRSEHDSWEAAKAGDSVASYSTYLESYPKGQFAPLAQAARQKAERLAVDREKKEKQEKLAVERQAAEREKQEAEIRRKAAEQERLAAEKAAKEMYPGKVFRDCSDCPDMVMIPAGSFDMGGTESDEKPVHRVTLKSFAMGKTEVTQAQWQAVMGSNPSDFKQCGGDCPVENVSWDDAQEFIRRLNAKTGKNYRLPSESEWEYACRAGSRDDYCGGNNLDAVGWYGAYATPVGNSAKTTNPVARKQANAWGLYDMSGNVWEWTQDCWNASYGGAPSDGSAWTSGSCTQRVARGASWFTGPQYARSAYRSRYTSTNRYNSVGFRLARTLSP